mgnify:CR=1 FL=1
MNAAQYDLIIDRAAEYRFTLTIKDRSGALVSITGRNFYSDIREKATKKTAVSFTPTITAAPTVGEVVLSLTEENTLLLNENIEYEWDLFMVTGSVPSQTTERLLFGNVVVRQNFTKGVPIDPIS